MAPVLQSSGLIQGSEMSEEVLELITPQSVLVSVQASCQREALTLLSQKAAQTTALPEAQILDHILERERLGSTGVGNGAAIPHAKLDALDHVVGLCARLEKPVPFDAIDDAPVDLIFMLLAPTDANATHLKALSRVARLLRNAETRKAMRGAATAEALYAIIIEEERSFAA